MTTSNYGSDNISAILVEREQTHGDFVTPSRVSQALKAVLSSELELRTRRGQPPLSSAAREALSMMCHKIGRIVAGKWDFPDHWDDIAGYSKLVSASLNCNSLQSSVRNSESRDIKPIAVLWGVDPGDSDEV